MFIFLCIIFEKKIKLKGITIYILNNLSFWLCILIKWILAKGYFVCWGKQEI